MPTQKHWTDVEWPNGVPQPGGSFFREMHRCRRCGGAFEIWEHNESGDKHIHYLRHPSTLFKIVCACREPKYEEQEQHS